MTKDDIPIIFHDDFILTEENVRISHSYSLCVCVFIFLVFFCNLELGKFGIRFLPHGFNINFVGVGMFQGTISERRVTEITLAEFLCYGPQREPGNVIHISQLFFFVLLKMNQLSVYWFSVLCCCNLGGQISYKKDKRWENIQLESWKCWFSTHIPRGFSES